MGEVAKDPRKKRKAYSVRSERGQAVGAGDDLAFSLGRKRFSVKPFHLPPVQGDQEKEEEKEDAQRAEEGKEVGAGKGKGKGKMDLDF